MTRVYPAIDPPTYLRCCIPKGTPTPANGVTEPGGSMSVVRLAREFTPVFDPPVPNAGANEASSYKIKD